MNTDNRLTIEDLKELRATLQEAIGRSEYSLSLVKSTTQSVHYHRLASLKSILAKIDNVIREVGCSHIIAQVFGDER